MGSLFDTRNGYGVLTKFFHWFVGCIFVFNLILGFVMVRSSFSSFNYITHKSLGFVALVFVVLRLLWRSVNVMPDNVKEMKELNGRLFKINIFLMYICMFIIPFSGFTASFFGGHNISFFGIFSIPSLSTNLCACLSSISMTLHRITVLIMPWLIVLHVIAAVFHHFTLKHYTIKRIC